MAGIDYITLGLGDFLHALVTGVAGFIGSHVAGALLDRGHQVVGMDCFTDYYPRWMKQRNIAGLRSREGFRFMEGDLLSIDLPPLLDGARWVFHQAAQAGVRASWGTTFEVYARDNILATQRLLEASKECDIEKLVYASSSSVYGDAESLPTTETALPRPVSPYGVTKLAAEHLCNLYYRNHRVPAVSLRYFTVYGPRQRPDMAFHIFGRALLTGSPVHVYGDGLQTRDFTFVDDAVAANLLAAERGTPGEVYNIGGGSRVTLREVLARLEAATGQRARIQYGEPQRGDARDTSASIEKARRDLSYEPQVDIVAGIAAETAWLREVLREERAKREQDQREQDQLTA